MNTRHAIQPSEQPAVLSIAYSADRKRFVVGLAEGIRIFRSDNCLTTYQPRLATSETVLTDGGVGVTAILDDRSFAFVKGGRDPRGSTNTFVFWDATLGKKIASFDFHEPIIALRLSKAFAAVTLVNRTVLLQYQKVFCSQQTAYSPSSSTVDEEIFTAPNKPHSLHTTAPNVFGLCILRPQLIVLPAQSIGQVQLVPLPTGSKRLLRAHDSQLRALALSDDESLIATASIQGTLIRVFDIRTLDQVAEFRRGVDRAIVYSLAISPGNRWVACTSDKGTLHIFDLRPDTIQHPAMTSETRRPSISHRSSITNTLRAPSIADPTLLPVESAARSSPPASVQYQGSVQEYYGLLPPPPAAYPASQTTAKSALNAFRNSAFAPKALKDIRSVASTNFHLGDEPPHWQGQSATVYTTTPDGKVRCMTNPIPPLAADPSGRPTKGVLAFAPENINDNDGALLYAIGGGSDARWERFRLIRSGSGSSDEWTLINEGFRKYLTRQFVE